MNTLQVPKLELCNTLYYYFSQDRDFIEKYHAKSGQGLDVCVAYELEVHQFDPKSRCYEIIDNVGNRTAFFALYDEQLECPSLALFFVSPPHRNRQEISSIWEKMLNKTPTRRFLIGLRERNLPATAFYRKMGAKPLFHMADPRNPNETVMLYYYNDARND